MMMLSDKFRENCKEKEYHFECLNFEELLQRVLSYVQTYHFSYVPLAGPVVDENTLGNPLDAYRASCYSLS